MIAIGIGCRRGAMRDSIVEIVRLALTQAAVDGEAVQMFSVEDKKNEMGLKAAAELLSLPLSFLPHRDLQEVEAKVVTHSQAATQVLGISSVCEAAALAGAGVDSLLIVPRITRNDVTCALARGSGR